MPSNDNLISPSDQETNVLYARSSTAVAHISSPSIRKIICRYGPGCTHILDQNHKEKFWHPSNPSVKRGDVSFSKNQFICNECGFGTDSVEDLQLHLKRKTAWSNQSLVGCRISCLVDYKEWHEGYVTQLHKSGKHYVEFRMVNEKRWLYMKKIAFYIVERPPYITSSMSSRSQSNFNDENGRSSEFKSESSLENDGLAPIESNWVYVENISIDYAFAQSVLFNIYGGTIQETGHLTKGHICLTESDRRNAIAAKGSLLYGELLPRGVNKALGPSRMDASNASVVFDLGMGTGKILIQSFLQFRNLRYLYGIELSSGRYRIAEEALLRLVQLLGSENFNIQINPGKFIVVREMVPNTDEDSDEPCERVIHFECGNMFSINNIEIADIVMMETDFPSELNGDLFKLLTGMQEGARVLSYLDLRKTSNGLSSIRDPENLQFSNHFQQLDHNRHLSDRYPTSWSVQRGHHFFLWIKINPANDPSAYKQSGSGSWGQSLSLGLGIAPSVDSTGQSAHYQGNPMVSNHNQSCIPVGFFRYLFGRAKKTNKNISESSEGNPPVASNSKSISLIPSNDRTTVIPINLDASRDDKKININIKKQQYNYPNYIERVISNQSQFLHQNSILSNGLSPQPSPRADNEGGLQIDIKKTKTSNRSGNSSYRSDSESEASPRSENGRRRKSRKNSKKTSNDVSQSGNNDFDSPVSIKRSSKDYQNNDSIRASQSDDLVRQKDDLYSPVKSEYADNLAPLNFMSSSYDSDIGSSGKKERLYINDLVTSPKDGNFCTPTTQLILASYNDQHPITFNDYDNMPSANEDITSLPFSTLGLSKRHNNSDPVARKLDYSVDICESENNVTQPINTNVLREPHVVSS